MLLERLVIIVHLLFVSVAQGYCLWKAITFAPDKPPMTIYMLNIPGEETDPAAPKEKEKWGGSSQL